MEFGVVLTGMPAEHCSATEQLRHRFGTNMIGVPDMLRCARDLGLKARAYRTSWDRLAGTPLPGIAVLRDGSFLLLGKVGDDCERFLATDLRERK